MSFGGQRWVGISNSVRLRATKISMLASWAWKNWNSVRRRVYSEFWMTLIILDCCLSLNPEFVTIWTDFRLPMSIRLKFWFFVVTWFMTLFSMDLCMHFYFFENPFSTQVFVWSRLPSLTKTFKVAWERWLGGAQKWAGCVFVLRFVWWCRVAMRWTHRCVCLTHWGALDVGGGG